MGSQEFSVAVILMSTESDWATQARNVYGSCTENPNAAYYCNLTGKTVLYGEDDKADNPITFERQEPAKKKYTQFIDQMKQMILSGRLKPGDRLPTESQLSEYLGISRTPIREAIKILESMGVITINLVRGCIFNVPYLVQR